MSFLQGVREAAIAAVGVYVAYIMLLFVGLLFLVPGVQLVRSVPEGESGGSKKIFGWVLIGIGCIIMLPFIIDVIFYLLASELDIFGGNKIISK